MERGESVKAEDMFRIVTDGLTYRIESLVTRRFLWWTWSRWECMWRFDYYALCDIREEFHTLGEAESAMKSYIAKTNAKVHGWTPVKPEAAAAWNKEAVKVSGTERTAGMSEKCPKCGGEVAMSEKFESGDTFPEAAAAWNK